MGRERVGFVISLIATSTLVLQGLARPSDRARPLGSYRRTGGVGADLAPEGRMFQRDGATAEKVLLLDPTNRVL